MTGIETNLLPRDQNVNKCGLPIGIVLRCGRWFYRGFRKFDNVRLKGTVFKSGPLNIYFRRLLRALRNTAQTG